MNEIHPEDARPGDDHPRPAAAPRPYVLLLGSAAATIALGALLVLFAPLAILILAGLMTWWVWTNG